MTSAEAFEQLKSQDGHDIEYLQSPYNQRNIFKIIHESVATYIEQLYLVIIMEYIDLLLL